MANNLYNTMYNPDVLSCIANLSNDEVFTPPEVANAMLDMLPQELFSDPTTTFLDPGCKSGVFLREIAKRLLVGLESIYPDLQERTDHIFKEQLYGIAITELTSHLSRRSLYCSKAANGNYSIVHFDTVDGNVRFKTIQHRWRKGKCVFCNASQNQYDRSEDLETHAYELIHTTKPEEIFKMKFDVIIGNPPYQLSDGGAQASASPLYHLFVQQAMKLNPRYLTMIIPARWYAGGKGLDTFRDAMLDDIHLKELHDFPITDDCFPGVNIRGGVCFFLWAREYDNRKNKTTVVTHENDNEYSVQRKLRYEDLDIFIRHGKALEILEKVASMTEHYLSEHVSSRKPFGLSTDFTKGKDYRESKSGMVVPLPCIGKGKQIGYVEKRNVAAHQEWIDVWKVIAPRANNIGTELNDDNLNAFVAKPSYICTESYIVIGGDMNLDESTAENLVSYLKTKFARFCHSLAKVSQDATAKTYRFVPMQDFTINWTDEALYKKYSLTEEEIRFIEELIKPME